MLTPERMPPPPSSGAPVSRLPVWALWMPPLPASALYRPRRKSSRSLNGASGSSTLPSCHRRAVALGPPLLAVEAVAGEQHGQPDRRLGRLAAGRLVAPHRPGFQPRQGHRHAQPAEGGAAGQAVGGGGFVRHGCLRSVRDPNGSAGFGQGRFPLLRRVEADEVDARDAHGAAGRRAAEFPRLGIARHRHGPRGARSPIVLIVASRASFGPAAVNDEGAQTLNVSASFQYRSDRTSEIAPPSRSASFVMALSAFLLAGYRQKEMPLNVESHNGPLMREHSIARHVHIAYAVYGLRVSEPGRVCGPRQLNVPFRRVAVGRRKPVGRPFLPFVPEPVDEPAALLPRQRVGRVVVFRGDESIVIPLGRESDRPRPAKAASDGVGNSKTSLSKRRYERLLVFRRLNASMIPELPGSAPPPGPRRHPAAVRLQLGPSSRRAAARPKGSRTGPARSRAVCGRTAARRPPPAGREVAAEAVEAVEGGAVAEFGMGVDRAAGQIPVAEAADGVELLQREPEGVDALMAHGALGHAACAGRPTRGPCLGRRPRPRAVAARRPAASAASRPAAPPTPSCRGAPGWCREAPACVARTAPRPSTPPRPNALTPPTRRHCGPPTPGMP